MCVFLWRERERERALGHISYGNLECMCEGAMLYGIIGRERERQRVCVKRNYYYYYYYYYYYSQGSEPQE